MRRHYWRRIKSSLIHFLPMGGLLLWAGILTVAWISLQRPAPKAVAKARSSAPAMGTQQQALRQEPRPPTADQSGKNRRDALIKGKSREPATAATHAKPAEVASERSTAPTTDEQALARAPRATTHAAPAANTGADSQSENHSADSRGTPVAHNAQAQTSEPKVKDLNKTPPEAPPAGKMSAEVSSPHVTRAQFTTGMENKEPVDRIEQVFHTRNQPTRRLYFFTELSGLRGETVTHNWEHEGRSIAKVSFHVGANHWRVYSSKKLTSAMTGRWRVVVTDSDGKTITTAEFIYKAP